MPDDTDDLSGVTPSDGSATESAPPLRAFEVTKLRSAELFAEMNDAKGPAGRTTARDGLVHLHLPLVEHCARRFRNRGEPFEDLVQVGTIGLLK